MLTPEFRFLSTYITPGSRIGDDLTTAPKDELCLRDLAEAVSKLNNEGRNLGIIFRRCPVDYSKRYDLIIERFNDIIIPIQPAWDKIGEAWNTILPTNKDLYLQINIIPHSEFVVNLGSSMVFDFVTQNKACAFMNYNYLNSENKAEEGVYVYDFVHFRSMESNDAVIWLSDPNNIAEEIQGMLFEMTQTVYNAKKWFERINLHPPQKASKRIWNALIEISN